MSEAGTHGLRYKHTSMSILDRILGRAPMSGRQPAAAPKPPPVTELPASVAANTGAPAARGGEERAFRAYDQSGRAYSVGRESWRRDVLLPGLAANHERPDALYELVARAAGDGFAEDVLDSARHLADIDPQPRRGAALLGAILLRLGDVGAALAVLERAIARHGEDVHLLTALARAYEAAGDHAKAQELLWRALQLDPNFESALGWMTALAGERGGRAAMLAAYARAAALPMSWRAPLWLAHQALESGDIEEATRRYAAALGRVSPAPGGLLLQMCDDLADGAHPELLVRLMQPHFDAARHGLAVAGGLLRAYFDLGLLTEARRLIDELHAQRRPEWDEQLAHWREKIDAFGRPEGGQPAPAAITVISFERPLWANDVLGFSALLPAKPSSAPRIHFVCGSGRGDDAAAHTALGRLSRALPLFLAEEVYLRTGAKCGFLLPWMPRSGFVLAGEPWTRAFLAAHPGATDALVFMHVDATRAPWLLRISVDAALRGAVELELGFGVQTMAHDAITLRDEMVARLADLLHLAREPAMPGLATPMAEALPAYVIALEQALVPALVARGVAGESLLEREREILDLLFHAAIDGAELLRPRMLFASALAGEMRRPDIAREYLDRLTLLQRRYPLPAGKGDELIDGAIRSLAAAAGRSG